MREALFIKKNKERWEEISNNPSEETDEMANEFIQLTDDLGYAKTFYKTSNVTKFLNKEASKRYLHIYANRKEESNKIIHFFKYDVPLAVSRHQLIVGICFLIFLIFFVVGFYSQVSDENFVRKVLGSGYVEMTNRNIEEGNPFGVYGTGNEFLSFLGIMINNISVSFRYFFEGLLFPFFTVKELIRDGIMVGSFDALFYSKGLGKMFLLTVMIHGTLELSAITIAAASGVVLGISWVFPGTRTRMEAFKNGAKDGIKMIIGLVPVFMAAAFFEGYVTRHYKALAAVAPWKSGLILLFSLAFIVWYFGIYPYQLRKRQQHSHA